MARFYYRLPPCPGYDFVGIEGWLENMAAKGMHLDGQGYVFGFFQFQKGGPAAVKFRLEANPKQSPLDLKPLEDPDDENIALYEDFGWEYWGQYREFYIYRSSDPNARELNTDPVVQAMVLDHVRKRAGFVLGLYVAMLTGLLLGFVGAPSTATLGRRAMKQVLRYVLLAVFALFGSAYLLGEKKSGKLSNFLSKCCVFSLYTGMVLSIYRMSNSMTPLLYILERGWLWWVAFGGVFLSLLITASVSYVHICKLQKGLRRGRVPDRTKKASRWPRMLEALPFVMLIFLNLTPMLGGRPKDMIPTEHVTGALPFPTLIQVLEGDRQPQGADNRIWQWKDLLSPVNFDWREEVWVDTSDGRRFTGVLAVTYHEAANATVAKRLVEEYSSFGQPDPSLIPDTVDGNDFDYLSVSKQIHPSMLIRKGNTVVYAYCSVQSWGDHENIYPLWLEQMAAALTGKE